MVYSHLWVDYLYTGISSGPTLGDEYRKTLSQHIDAAVRTLLYVCNIFSLTCELETTCEDWRADGGAAAAAVEPGAVALAAADGWPGAGGPGAPRRRPACRRDRTLTNANSIRDEKTNTRQTIIQMSIACTSHIHTHTRF